MYPIAKGSDLTAANMETSTHPFVEISVKRSSAPLIPLMVEQGMETYGLRGVALRWLPPRPFIAPVRTLSRARTVRGRNSFYGTVCRAH